MSTSYNASYRKSKYHIVHNNKLYINKLHAVKKYPILRHSNRKALALHVKT